MNTLTLRGHVAATLALLVAVTPVLVVPALAAVAIGALR